MVNGRGYKIKINPKGKSLNNANEFHSILKKKQKKTNAAKPTTRIDIIKRDEKSRKIQKRK
jgi:hypothetical protein